MPDFSREMPQQLRAQHSVACILEASAQLLDRANVGSVTTNHIAERAGVSIGTLYRYFRDKDHVFDALARNEIKIMARKGMTLIGNQTIASGNALVGEFVDIAFGAFNSRPFVRRNLHEIIGTQSPIARDLQLRRLRFCCLIEERLRYIEPTRFRALKDEERRCVVSAWRAILNETLEEDALRFHRADAKRLLSGAVLSYFSA